MRYIRTTFIAFLIFGSCLSISASAGELQRRFFSAWYTSAAVLEIPRDGLVGEWLFSQNALDTSGRSDHGTLQNGAIISGGSLFLGGTNERVSLDTTNTISRGQSNLTFSVWIKTNNDSVGTIFSELVSGVVQVRILLGLTSGARFRLAGRKEPFDSFSTFAVSEENAILANTWHHLIGVYSDDGNHAVWADGQNITESVDDTAGAFEDLDSEQRWIGLNNPISGVYFDGKISKLRVYNRVLLEDEIQALYNEGPPQ